MIRLLILAFWSAVALAFVLAALPHPPQIPTSDKVQHMAAFACMAVLGSLAYPRLAPLKLAAGLTAFGAVIELVQLIPVLHRDSELSDWLADIAAVTVALLLVKMWRAARAED